MLFAIGYCPIEGYLLKNLMRNTSSFFENTKKNFVLCTYHELRKTTCIFGKLSARAFQKHIVLYTFEI